MNPTLPTESTDKVRLQKVIAQCGIASRRKAEELILSGRVQINGKTHKELGTKVDPKTDVVSVDNKVLNPEWSDKLYLLFNKPKGVVTTVTDPEGRKTVMDFFYQIPTRIFPVGRLDYHSEGLLIMTNDGDMAHKILHPSFDVTKVYEVKVFGLMTPEILTQLRNGIRHQGELLRPKSVRVVKKLLRKTWIEFRLTEGKNREIRRLCEGVGLTIDKLRRVAIEGLSIEGIAPGSYEMISKRDLLKALNWNTQGAPKEDQNSTYRSSKRSVRFKAKKAAITTGREKATDRKFIKFRKEYYKGTINSRKRPTSPTNS